MRFISVLNAEFSGNAKETVLHFKNSVAKIGSELVLLAKIRA